MSEQDQSHRSEAKSQADQTLLGVAPPRIDSSADASQRSPVMVRSGTSVADVEGAPPSRVALPSRPPSPTPGSLEILAAVSAADGVSNGVGDRLLVLARRRPVLWMVLTPVLLAAILLLLGRHRRTRPTPAAANSTAAAERSAPVPSNKVEGSPSPSTLADLEARPPESLNSRELLLLAEAHSERQRAEALALRRKLEATPALAKDSAVQSELLHLAGDERTARDALATMAALAPPIGADLLYEAWTGTTERSDTTELARALVYSPDVRPTASPALAVALDLRVAETCEAYKGILPSALKDGDRRSLHLLTKLNSKRGCGPKKAADCNACLRAASDELTATINAVKSRRPPNYAAQ
jgi:hypothetical protein